LGLPEGALEAAEVREAGAVVELAAAECALFAEGARGVEALSVESLATKGARAERGRRRQADTALTAEDRGIPRCKP
jgi:hypothetical protein